LRILPVPEALARLGAVRDDDRYAAVESQYRQSAYVKEICVFGRPCDDDPRRERLFAVVVPDMILLRQKRIVNAGDLLRFELEGQSIHLPPPHRIVSYDVWFEPLPRTSAGELRREEIHARLRQKAEEARARAAGRDDDGKADQDTAAALEIVRRYSKDAAVWPDANLEIDLGLDSMDRVELIAELEQRFGVRVPDDQVCGIFTLQQLFDAVRPAGAAPTEATKTADIWAMLLKDPSGNHPAVATLSVRRRVVPLMFFAFLRLARIVMPRVVVRGREHLPGSGPYIIAPNHQSYLDPFFLSSVLPYAVFKELFVVGAAEYFETRLTAWLARQLSLVPVDPDANLVPAMQAGAWGLAQNRILLLFPEGERSIDGRVKRFKKGAAILARHLDLPIVPVAIHGVFRVWPRNRPFNWRCLLPGSGHHVQIAFGEPLHVARLVTADENTETLRRRVDELWHTLNASPQQRRENDRCADGAGEQHAGLGGVADKH
jgi:long-chain acyl-CoA synthetase